MLNTFYGPLFFKQRSVVIKTLRVMNFTGIFLILCGLQVGAEVHSEGITTHVKNAPLNEVFHEIRKQPGWRLRVEWLMKKENLYKMYRY